MNASSALCLRICKLLWCFPGWRSFKRLLHCAINDKVAAPQAPQPFHVEPAATGKSHRKRVLWNHSLMSAAHVDLTWVLALGALQKKAMLRASKLELKNLQTHLNHLKAHLFNSSAPPNFPKLTLTIKHFRIPDRSMWCHVTQILMVLQRQQKTVTESQTVTSRQVWVLSHVNCHAQQVRKQLMLSIIPSRIARIAAGTPTQ